jgi:hypothetical protein
MLTSSQGKSGIALLVTEPATIRTSKSSRRPDRSERFLRAHPSHRSASTFCRGDRGAVLESNAIFALDDADGGN